MIGKITRDTGIPWKSYLLCIIPSVLYAVVHVLVTAWMFRSWNFWIVFFLDIASAIVSLLFGGFWGELVVGPAYGHRSSGYSFALAFIAIVGTLIFDGIYLFTVVPTYSGGLPWIMGIMVISISIEIISCVVTFHMDVKSCYCEKCSMSNVKFFEKDEDGAVRYADKIVHHDEEKKTKTINTSTRTTFSDSTFVDTNRTHTIEYTVPAYDENLGLHKYTDYTSYYKCKNCGHISKTKGTREEKA